MMENIKISIIIVTYNSETTISFCLKSIIKYSPNQEIIIVDNNSQDRTKEVIGQFGEKVILIASKENLGFAKACNLAASKASGHYLFFLNPDAQILKDTIEKLLSFAKTHPEAGLIAPQLIKYNGEVQPSVKKLPTLTGVICEYYLGQIGAYHEFVPKNKEPVEVEAVYGAAILIKKSIFQKLGGFNEKYFLYYEDLDLCRRIKGINMKIFYYPNVKVIHEVGSSVKSLSCAKLPLGLRTLSNFFPFKEAGSGYYQIISGNIYHGFIGALIIRVLIYISLKMRLYRT